jgi:hypothetical protein
MTNLARPAWRKSARSGGSGGNSGCVEVADNLADVVAVRDSKDPDGTVLEFARGEWAAFIDAVKDGEFDQPEEIASSRQNP